MNLRHLKSRVGRFLILPFLIGVSLFLARADQLTSVFENSRPIFNPLKYYTGHTRSWGFFENRGAEATQHLTTETWGRVVNGELRMEQDLYIGSKPRQHRSWRMRRVDAPHFEATANDIIGTAHGEASGNAFLWSFTLALKPSNPLFNVQMTQHMYLQPDGKTVINRDTIRKFGILLAEVTEQFRHL
jgi:hypothetical protein